MQNSVFSDMDGLRIAAEMEKRGGEFYRLAARVCPSEETRALLTALAADESVHLAEFQRLYERERQRSDAPVYREETGALLSSIAADIVFTDGVVGLARRLDDPVAILNEAIRSEQDSIRFYEEMTRAAEGQTARVFGDIIRQERGHLNRLQKSLSEIAGKD